VRRAIARHERHMPVRAPRHGSQSMSELHVRSA
jgi:hypothetical protein